MIRTVTGLAAGSLAAVVCGGLAGCATKPVYHQHPSPSPTHYQLASPSASPSTPATITLVLAVSTLPTTFGVPGDNPGYPTTLTVAVPTSFSGEVAAYGVAGTVILGPSGWTGSGQVGVDGSVGFTLSPSGESAGAGSEMVFRFDGACAGCAWSDASAYFPELAAAAPSAGLGSEPTPLPGLQTEPLAAGLIGYSLPASLPGDQVEGVAYTNLPAATTDPIFDSLELTLPAAEHPLATVLLNALVANQDRYLCPSGSVSPSIPLSLSAGSC